MSMLSLAEAQSAREQKGKHRPPDARAAQQQRWAETVEHWASEADAAWKLLSEARGRLRSADVALRGEQGRFAQSHTRGYTTFTRGEHGVRIPSPETVAVVEAGAEGTVAAINTTNGLIMYANSLMANILHNPSVRLSLSGGE